MTRVPEGRHREEKTPGEEEAALRRQAETGVMQPPAKACRGHPELGAAGRTHQPSEGAMSLLTPRFRTSDFQNSKRRDFCCKPPGLWYFLTAALGN